MRLPKGCGPTGFPRSLKQNDYMKFLADDELASAAFVLRARARHGDRHALQQAERLERLLKTRLGPTPSGHAPLEMAHARRAPWWNSGSRPFDAQADDDGS